MKRSLTQNEKKICEYLIKVLSSAVNEMPSPIPFEGINWETLIYFAKRCKVVAMLSNVILNLPEEHLPENKVIVELKKQANLEILIDGNKAYETDKILCAFEEYKIKNLPLKGYFMKMEYPRSDFRSAADLDVLFERNQIDAVKKAFESLGYRFLHNDDNQYHFQKKPYMLVEMHATLVHEWEHYYPYLVDQLERSEKRKGYNYSYEMSADDYYLYMLVHNSNHFRIGGLGIRMILDTYVYYKNHKDEFNLTYLNNRLREYKLDKFEERVRTLAFDWFLSDEPKIRFDDFEVYILLSGSLGRTSAGVMISSHKNIKKTEREGKKGTKFSFFIKSVCPNKAKMKINYPYLEKYPFLLPYSWACMWCRRFFVEKNVSIKNGLKNRFSYTDEDVNYFKGILNEVGFHDFD